MNEVLIKSKEILEEIVKEFESKKNTYPNAQSLEQMFSRLETLIKNDFSQNNDWLNNILEFKNKKRNKIYYNDDIDNVIQIIKSPIDHIEIQRAKNECSKCTKNTENNGTIGFKQNNDRN